MKKREIILASSSPRRKELLKKLIKNFKVFPVDIPERVKKGESAARYAKRLAVEKAEEAKGHLGGGALVIGADTVVAIGKKILGKPIDKNDARRMLKLLSGKTHTVTTAFCMLDAGSAEKIVRSVKTKVDFRRLKKGEIEDYIKTDEPFDKAGAYAAQGGGSRFIKKIEGSYTNVVGLPVEELKEALKAFGLIKIRRERQGNINI